MNDAATIECDAYSLEAVLRQRLDRRVRGLQVLILHDGLVLRGRAPSFYIKQLAQHAAMQVSGLAILANEIDVEPLAPVRFPP